MPGLAPWVRVAFGVPWLERLAPVYLWFALMTGVFVLFEWLLPAHERKCPYWQALNFWALYLIVSVIAAKSASGINGHLAMPPLVDLSAHPALKLVWVFVFDFFYYRFHRLQHALPLLWRFHAVHHSITDLSAIGSYHHVSEEFWRLPLVTIPVALLVSSTPGEIVLFSAFLRAWGLFIHSRSAAHLGPLRRVFADNHYHWVHHSTNPAHWGRNFAAFFPVWDWLFGTQVLPVQGEVSTITFGLPNPPPPKSLWQYLSGRLPERLHHASPSTIS